METLNGTVFCYSATGEGPHLCFYSDEPSGGFLNTYSFDDAETLEVFDKKGKHLWVGSPKGKQVVSMAGHYLIVPKDVSDPKRFVDWCFAEYPAKLTGNMKSWGAK